jgi:hypothetical protein
MMKKLILFLLALLALAFLAAGGILYKSHDIAPLVYSPFYPLIGLCFLIAGIILIIAFVFKWHHNNVPKLDLLKSYFLVLSVMIIMSYIVAPYAEKFLHKLYRKEVKAEIGRRIRGFFSSRPKKEKPTKEQPVEQVAASDKESKNFVQI